MLWIERGFCVRAAIGVRRFGFVALPDPGVELTSCSASGGDGIGPVLGLRLTSRRKMMCQIPSFKDRSMRVINCTLVVPSHLNCVVTNECTRNSFRHCATSLAPPDIISLATVAAFIGVFFKLWLGELALAIIFYFVRSTQAICSSYLRRY